MNKYEVKNRHNQKLSIVVSDKQLDKLVFVTHGLGGWKEAEHLELIRDTY
ncbi:hypothetical protein KBC31_03925 [Candidatus Saccharibacteria bacterium]|nr:hypothetical protein [Candidatus Saccharibacteria bacterium]